MAASTDARLLDLFDANKTVDADYNPTVGGGYLDSAEGIVTKDTLVYVPGGYTTVGELGKLEVGGFSMAGGRRRPRKTRRRQRGGRRKPTLKFNLRAQIRLRSRSQRRH